jgi:hypothetical protein
MRPHDTELEGVPGWEIVAAGLADIAAGRVTIEAELVKSAAHRLETIGLPVPSGQPSAGSRLYELVAADVGEARAHGRYNALRRRLASFIRTAAHARTG